MYSRQSLRVGFPRPGFFIGDARVRILLDGQVVHESSFRDGFDLELPIAAGPHTLSTMIELGPVQRHRAYALDVIAGQASSFVLRYSRLWGNFTRRLALAQSIGPTQAARGPTFRWAIAALVFVFVCPAAFVFVYFAAVTVSPPVTPDGHGLMPIGQVALALLLSPALAALAAYGLGRPASR